jgi:hypothetical protein
MRNNPAEPVNTSQVNTLSSVSRDETGKPGMNPEGTWI